MFYILLLFFVGIVACYFIAKAIVNYVPRKVRPFISLLLAALTIFVAWKLYGGVMKPIQFNQEKQVRYAKVIKSLKVVRDAQAAHRKVTGSFAANGDDLIKFIDTAKFAVTQARNEIRNVDKGGGISVEEEFRVIDTTGYTDVRANFVGRDYKNLMKVPGTNVNFTMKLGKVEKTGGYMAPVYFVSVPKSVILDGMDKELIKIEESAVENDQVKGTELSIGSLAEVSDAGNWPPAYDLGDFKE